MAPVTKDKGIVYIDGPDCCGKTTLAKEIIRQVGGDPELQYIHATYDKAYDMFEYHSRLLKKAIEIAERSVAVIDRLWVSEEVYAEAFRRGTAWPESGRLLHRRMLKHAAVNVLCTTNYDFIRKNRFDRAGQPEMWPENGYDEVLRGFDQLFNGSRGHIHDTYGAMLSKRGGLRELPYTILYDVVEHGSDMASRAAQVLSNLRVLRRLQIPLALTIDARNWGGHIATAKALLIGDTPSSHPNDPPFNALSSSSLTLAHCLTKASVSEADFCIMNSNATLAPQFLQQARDRASGIKIVTLGQRAEKWAILRGCPIHRALEHPQYIRRFRSAHLPTYAAALREAILGIA